MGLDGMGAVAGPSTSTVNSSPSSGVIAEATADFCSGRVRFAGAEAAAAGRRGENVALIARPNASMLSNRSWRFLAIILATMSDSIGGMEGFTSCSAGAVTCSLACHFIHRSDSLCGSRTMSAKISLNLSLPTNIS